MKRLLPVLIAFLAFSPLHAQLFSLGTDWHAALSPRIGISSGTVGEYIFAKKEYGWKQNSHLQWKEQIVNTYGIALDAYNGGLNFKGYFDIGLPIWCGSMEDKDWMDDSHPELNTTRSLHDLYAQGFFTTGAVLWYEFDTKLPITLAPIASSEFLYRDFKAKNGEAWHGESAYSQTEENVAWDDEAARYFEKVCDIVYCYQSLNTYLGLMVIVKGTPRLRTEFALLFAPYSYTYARDIHYGYNKTTKTQYQSTYMTHTIHSFLDKVKGYAAIRYRLNNTVELGLSATYLFSDAIKADYRTKDLYTGKFSEIRTNVKGGFSISELSVKLFAKVHLF